jgi:cobalt-zinc-cadmium efflux system membrane fusion protein
MKKKTPVMLLTAAALVALGYGLAQFTRLPASQPGPEAARPSTAKADPGGKTLPRPGTVAAGGADPISPDTVHFDTGAAQLASIRVEEARLATVPLAEPLNARLAYDENRTARLSVPISGRVLAIRRQAGDAVRAGEELLSVDSPELAAALADVRKARSDDQRRRLAFERSQRLAEAGVLARRELENAQAEFEAARAETERAERRLRNLAPAGADNPAYSLRAPLSGVVAERRVNPGQEVRPDQAEPLFVVSDLAHLWVLIDLPERDLRLVKPGQRALVKVDAWPDERFAATIERVGAVVDPATRRVQVRATLENPDHRLRPEMYSQVILASADAGQAVRLPNNALVTQGLYSYVFIENPPGFFTRRKVKLGVQDRTHAFIIDGVEAGEMVVTTGALLLNSELTTLVK